MSYHPNRGRGRGRGRSGGGGGHHRSGGPSEFPQARLRPCRSFTTTGSCNNPNCSFAHVVQLHASIEATSMIKSDSIPSPPNSRHGGYNQNYYPQQKAASVQSIAIWETQNTIKIFTASEDGFWRLWNTSAGKFVKEFEHNMGGGQVECLEVASNFLFVGFEAVSLSLPDVKVGMVHAWNLATPTNPPLEFHMHTLAPYAHSRTVSQIKVVGPDHKILSGSRDGVVRVWSYQVDKFVLMQTMYGHAGEVTGLALVDAMLWSCSSVDRSIRLWDLNKNGELMHVITSKTPGGGVANNPQTTANPTAPGVGHTNAITGLVSFASPAGNFCLSSSLDGTVKAWNGQNADCVASESHGAGVVSMAMSTDQKGNSILLVGLETGNLMVRNVLQTAGAPAFCLLFVLSKKFTVGHDGPVKAIRGGPSSTFYSGGEDGKLLVWQITGDLGL